MKKVCIVTLYGNSNLGNKLQNYAVQQKCVQSNYEVKTLKLYSFEDNSNKSKIYIYLMNVLRRIKYMLFEKRMYINEKFVDFQREYLLMDNWDVFSNEDNKILNKKYDYFIVGSDQVWNPDFGLKGNLLFLEFARKNKISFSASVGVDKIPEDQKEKYENGLKKMNYISVREDKAKQIVEELTDRNDVEVLVDPTMLLTKSEWQAISKKPDNINNGKYILTYFLGNMSQSVKENIEAFAKKNNLEIIDVMENGNPKSWIGPSEFIYLEEHAELICTDSFHSCVFGILMETPFVVFDRIDNNKSMNSRLDTLLSKFKLEDRKYNGILTEKVLSCDFSHCEEILKIEREKADKFLKKALDIN